MGGADLWKIEILTDEAVAAALETVLGDDVLSFSRFEEKPPAPGTPVRWHVLALVGAAPDAAALTEALASATGIPRDRLPVLSAEALPEEDWLALNRRQFPPIEAGRFFIHGSHFEEPPPAGRIALCLNAGPAFGSGTHETTRGCLLAIDAILRERGDGPLRALDVGCGSGILALAIAAALSAADLTKSGSAAAGGAGPPVIATDIDATATATTLENAANNGLAARVCAYAGDGVSGKEVAAGAPYDLIVANILAEPLVDLAPHLAGLLAAGGRLVLSGLLTTQEDLVLAACRAAGLSLRRTIVLGDWSTMILNEGD